MNAQPRAAGPALALLMVLALEPLAGCGRPNSRVLQGYVEGEFVYVASARSGEVTSLEVARGTQVALGDLLYTLDSTSETAAVEETQQRLAEAEALLADARKGLRSSELQSLEAQLKQAESALELAAVEQARVQRLVRTGSVTEEEFDRLRATRDQAEQRVVQLRADLETARLGARPDQIAAAEANVAALEAALAQAQWNLDEKRQTAPVGGVVFDALYRVGEWASAGSPVVALLPPDNVKVRFFVPEARVAQMQVGSEVRVAVDGLPGPVTGRVSFISPRVEYTPPVIYSREIRAKLVYMVEATFDAEVAAQLHPGQPVDVELASNQSIMTRD